MLKNDRMNFEELNFVTYCVDNLSRRLNWSAAKVYDKLRTSGILSSYIISSYDVLHTFSKEYIMQDIIDYMQEKGVLK